jgi:hypothetical protein
MKSLLIALGTLLTLNLQAQESLKPQSGDWSTEATFYAQFGSNALRFGLNDIKVRRFTQENRVQRLRLLATQNNETTIILGGQGNMERNIKEGSVVLAPGFEKHLKGSNRLSPYWGAELIIGKSFYEYNLTNSVNGQSFSQGGNFNTKTQKAFSFGANAVFGADYYISKKLFIGAEVGYGFIHQSFGESSITIENNGNQTDNKTVPMGKTQGLQLFANPGLRLGIAF